MIIHNQSDTIAIGSRVAAMPVALVRPKCIADKFAAQTKLTSGIVTYIHPQRRFFTLEFAAPGGSFRESFPFPLPPAPKTT